MRLCCLFFHLANGDVSGDEAYLILKAISFRGVRGGARAPTGHELRRFGVAFWEKSFPHWQLASFVKFLTEAFSVRAMCAL